MSVKKYNNYVGRFEHICIAEMAGMVYTKLYEVILFQSLLLPLWHFKKEYIYYLSRYLTFSLFNKGGCLFKVLRLLLKISTTPALYTQN